MISLFDTNFLLLLLKPEAPVPPDFETNQMPDRACERIECFVKEMSKNKGKIVIPSVVLAEFLLFTGKDHAKYSDIIKKKSVFDIAGFDHPEAIILVEQALGDGRLKTKSPNDQTRAKLKYDRQIAAIAKTARATAIYSTDQDLHRLARRLDIKACNIKDLPYPPAQQLRLLETYGGDPQDLAETIPMRPEDPASVPGMVHPVPLGGMKGSETPLAHGAEGPPFVANEGAHGDSADSSRKPPPDPEVTEQKSGESA